MRNYSKTNNLKIITTEKDYFKINEKFQKMLYKLKLKIFNEKNLEFNLQKIKLFFIFYNIFLLNYFFNL